MIENDKIPVMSSNLASPRRSRTPSKWGKNDYLKYNLEGRPYHQIWKEYNSVVDCVKILDRDVPSGIKSVVVLGTATGEILKFFDSSWNTRPYGCELSEWAYRQIPHPYRERVKNQDMRQYVKEFQIRVDIVYANSFMYLAEQDISLVLKECARIGRFVFADLSYSECFEYDRHRKVLKPHRWWRDKFREAGLVPFKKYRRIWQSAS